MESTFEKELKNLINKHSLENESNTPDFILAEYIIDALDSFTNAVNKREEWAIEEESEDTPELISGTHDALNKLSVRGE